MAAAGNITGMSTKFYLPDGQVTDLVAVNLPVFLARTPDEMIEFLTAFRPDPATGKPDPAKVQEFLASHPAALRAYEILQQAPAPVSFARFAYPRSTPTGSSTRRATRDSRATTGSRRRARPASRWRSCSGVRRITCMRN